VTGKPDLSESVELDTSGHPVGSPHLYNSQIQMERDSLTV